MKNWLKKPLLIQPDSNAKYEEIIEIDLAKVTQPIVACPNDPDNVKEITDVANTNICLLYTSPSPRDLSSSRMPSSA